MARKKTPSTTKAETIETRAEFDFAVDLIASLSAKLDEMRAIKEQRLQELTLKEDEAIKPVENNIAELVKATEAYAAPRRVELFGKDKKSATTSLARFGYRIGQPTLKQIKGWTKATILAKVKKARLKSYLIVKESLNKEKLRTNFDEKKLASFGLKVEQEETFFVERLTEKLAGSDEK